MNTIIAWRFSPLCVWFYRENLRENLGRKAEGWIQHVMIEGPQTAVEAESGQSIPGWLNLLTESGVEDLQQSDSRIIRQLS
jgi:hypothetical protein